MKIDEFARVCPFRNWNESFYGNCKMRAGRMIWAKLVKQFEPKDDKFCVHIVKHRDGA
jgi:methylmalonyl-CoA mutase